jgi:hypothetical protein
VFDNAAQVTLVGTQVWWATEVGIAFGKLEEGFETAMKVYYKVGHQRERPNYPGFKACSPSRTVSFSRQRVQSTCTLVTSLATGSRRRSEIPTLLFGSRSCDTHRTTTRITVESPSVMPDSGTLAPFRVLSSPHLPIDVISH